MHRQITVADLPRLNAARYQNRPAYIFEDVPMSWREVDTEAQKAAHALQSLGAACGERVAIFAENSLDWLVAYFGALSTGAIVVPINTMFEGDGLVSTLGHADASIVIAGRSLAGRVQSVRDQLTSVRHFVGIDGAGDGFLELRDAGEQYCNFPRLDVGLRKDDEALILYTGGTTGLAKGAVITHGSHYGMLMAEALHWAVLETDVNLNCLPLFHNAGLHITLNSSFVGATTVLLKRPDGPELFAALERYRVTRTALVTGVLDLMLHSPAAEGRVVTDLRWVLTAGSVLSDDLKTLVKKVFPNAAFVQGYGLTDATSLVTVLHERDLATKAESCGQPYGNVELRVVDEHGVDVPIGETGEIIVSGDLVMKEYWREPDLTAAVLRDGWLYTGDIGRLDEDGFLFFVDRTKDVIKSGEETIFAMELEQVIYRHPGVDEVAVIGVPDPRWTETPMAIVVRHAGSTLDEAELIEYVRANAPAKYMRLSHVRFAESLPRTPIGKVFKPTLKSLYLPTLTS